MFKCCLRAGSFLALRRDELFVYNATFAASINIAVLWTTHMGTILSSKLRGSKLSLLVGACSAIIGVAMTRCALNCSCYIACCPMLVFLVGWEALVATTRDNDAWDSCIACYARAFNVFVRVCLCVYVCMCMYVYFCMCVCMCMYVCVCLCLCMYLCVCCIHVPLD